MDGENQSPQTAREDRTKNRFDPHGCYERAFDSQFVHEEHDEDLHDSTWFYQKPMCATR